MIRAIGLWLTDRQFARLMPLITRMIRAANRGSMIAG